MTVKYSLCKVLKYNYILKLDGYYAKTYENYDMGDFHKHNRIELMLVEDGECEIQIIRNEEQDNCEKITLGQNECILIDSYVWHKLVVTGNCRIINLEFLLVMRTIENLNVLREMSQLSSELSSFLQKFDCYMIVYDRSNIRNVAKIIVEEATDSMNCSDYEVVINSYTNLLITEIARSYCKGTNLGSYELPVKKAIRYIHSHIREITDTGEVAKYAGVSYSYLEQLFKKRTSMTLGEYITRQKVELACTMLTETMASVATIAEQIGFSSRQQMNNSFKRIKNTSPQNYRHESRGKREEIWYGFSGNYDLEYMNQKKEGSI